MDIISNSHAANITSANNPEIVKMGPAESRRKKSSRCFWTKCQQARVIKLSLVLSGRPVPICGEVC